MGRERANGRERQRLAKRQPADWTETPAERSVWGPSPLLAESTPGVGTAIPAQAGAATTTAAPLGYRIDDLQVFPQDAAGAPAISPQFDAAQALGQRPSAANSDQAFDGTVQHRLEEAFAGPSDDHDHTDQANNGEAAVVQRSMTGAIVGGIIGGVGGFLLGGPEGAAIGAGIGAGLGETATTRLRPLSSDEQSYAHDIFLDSLNYSAIVISRNSAFAVGDTARTVGNTINMDDGEFVDDTMELTPEGKNILIHEMTHVWQYQHNGWTYAPEALWAQFKAAVSSGSRNAAYDWESLDAAGTAWDDWNPEAQAAAVEEYNRAYRAAMDGSATADDYAKLSKLQKYLDKITAGPPSPAPDKGDYSAPASGASAA